MINEIKNIKEQDYYSKVNLHIHTNLSDGTLSPQQIIENALKLGMKTISITDHNTVDAYKHIDPKKYPQLQIISGVEFDCWYKTDLLHILGYGIDVTNEEILKLCATDKMGRSTDLIRFFNRRKAKTVIKAIKNAGGIPILAHPACCWNINIENLVLKLAEMGLEGLETYYPYVGHRGIIKFSTVNKIKKIAQKHNLLITGGTDCHSTNLLGR